jgi:hypothetical protein
MADKEDYVKPISLRWYIKQLQELEKKYGDLPLCYSSDQEGNYFEELYIGPNPVELIDGDEVMYEEETEEITHILIN